MKHNSYFDDKVQSLGFTYDGVDCTVGVIEPGEYDFGIAGRPEAITPLVGELVINGKNYTTTMTRFIHEGDTIKIKTDVPAAYLCRYGV